MKKYLLILSLFLASCTDYNTSRYAMFSPSIILDKREIHSKSSYYNLYVYNGNNSEWYSVTPDDYNKCKIGDTFPGLTLIIERTVKND